MTHIRRRQGTYAGIVTADLGRNARIGFNPNPNPDGSTNYSVTSSRGGQVFWGMSMSPMPVHQAARYLAAAIRDGHLPCEVLE